MAFESPIKRFSKFSTAAVTAITMALGATSSGAAEEGEVDYADSFVFAIQSVDMQGTPLSCWYEAPVLQTSEGVSSRSYIDMDQATLVAPELNYYTESKVVAAEIEKTAGEYKLTTNERLKNAAVNALGIGLATGAVVTAFGFIPVVLIGGVAAAVSGAAFSEAAVLSILFFPSAGAGGLIGAATGFEEQHPTKTAILGSFTNSYSQSSEWDLNADIFQVNIGTKEELEIQKDVLQKALQTVGSEIPEIQKIYCPEL